MNASQRHRTPLVRPADLGLVSGHPRPRRSNPRRSHARPFSVMLIRSQSMTTRTRPTLTSPEVCELTGLTYRRLDHWTRTGRISSIEPDVGSGSQRRYSTAVVGEVRSLLKRIDACPLQHGGLDTREKTG